MKPRIHSSIFSVFLAILLLFMLDTPFFHTPGPQLADAGLDSDNLIAPDQAGTVSTLPGSTKRLSVATDGTQANNGASWPVISANGRIVAFQSTSSNLVSGDTNQVEDVFVRDNATGHTQRVSVSSEGTQGNDYSHLPDVSADGRFVVFVSAATNLVAGDTNNELDVFVHDLATGTTSLVSVASDGTPGNRGSFQASISADGRFIAFNSASTNLVNSDTNGSIQDIFVRDQVTGVTTLVSIAPQGEQWYGITYWGIISADGRFIAFRSWGSYWDLNEHTVFLHDRLTGATTEIPSGSNPSATFYDRLAISADGRLVTFVSVDANLVSGDTNNMADAFVYDRTNHSLERVSVASDGTQSDGEAWYVDISANGRFVAFSSGATNLAGGGMSENNGNIFVRDRVARTTTPVSISSSGVYGNQYSELPSLSDDGSQLVFGSPSDNLVSGDTNGVGDIFLRDRRSELGSCYALNLTPTLGGSILPLTPPDCGGGTYTAGSIVRLRALPQLGTTFVGWGRDASGASVLLNLPMIGNLSVQANFASSSSPARRPLVLVHGFLGAVTPDAYTDHCTANLTQPFHYSANIDCNANPNCRNDGVGGKNIDYFDDVPLHFHNANYDVWIAHVASGPTDLLNRSAIKTPALEVNGACLASQLEYIHQQNPLPLTIVAHSMGGAVSRACLARNTFASPNCHMAKQLITLGTPHGGLQEGVVGWGWWRHDTVAQAGLLQLSDPHIATFNRQTPNQYGIDYFLLGGEVLGSILATGHLGDRVVGRASAVGWANETGETNPPHWDTGWCDPASQSCSITPWRFWTDDWHSEYFQDRNGVPSDSHTCVAWFLNGHSGNPPTACRVAAASSNRNQPLQTAEPVLETAWQQEGSTLAPGHQTTIPVLVDTSGHSFFNLSWMSGNLTFSLTRPDGQLINAAYASAHPDVVAYNLSPASLGIPNTASYALTTTLTGGWQLNIYNAGATSVVYGANLALASSRLLRLTTSSPVLTIDTNATLTATLTNGTSGISGATVTAVVARADGISDTLTLIHQGGGIYRASYQVPNAPGYLPVTVRASGTEAQTPFTRQENFLWAVAPRSAGLNQSYSENPRDDDGNGLFERLDLQVGVTSTRAGNFSLSGDLRSGSEIVAHANTPGALGLGTQRVTLSFHGDHLRQARRDGPYTLTNLTLTDLDQGGIPIIQTNDVWTTAPYSWQTFATSCFALTVNTLAGGNVSANPEPNCNQGAQYTFDSVVTLAASPTSSFVGWRGDVNGRTTPVTITLDRDRAVTASFNCPDFNSNGLIDATDIQGTVGRWHRTESLPNWDPRFDMNGDGVIALVDVMEVSTLWGTPCSLP